MPSRFHHNNEKIRKAIARRAKEKGLAIDDEEAALSHEDLAPDEPGDGRIVRKRIPDEGEDWYDV